MSSSASSRPLVPPPPPRRATQTDASWPPLPGRCGISSGSSATVERLPAFCVSDDDEADSTDEARKRPSREIGTQNAKRFRVGEKEHLSPVKADNPGRVHAAFARGTVAQEVSAGCASDEDVECASLIRSDHRCEWAKRIAILATQREGIHLNMVSHAWKEMWPNDNMADFRPRPKLKEAVSRHVSEVELVDDRIYVRRVSNSSCQSSFDLEAVGHSAKRAKGSVGLEIHPEARPCAANCGFQVTWHGTHCCNMCCEKPGSHGPHCDREHMGQAAKATTSNKWAQRLLELAKESSGMHIMNISGCWKQKWPHDDIEKFKPCKKMTQAVKHVHTVELRDGRIYVPGISLRPEASLDHEETDVEEDDKEFSQRTDIETPWSQRILELTRAHNGMHILEVGPFWKRKWPNDDIYTFKPVKKMKQSLKRVKTVELRGDRVYVPGLASTVEIIDLDSEETEDDVDGTISGPPLISVQNQWSQRILELASESNGMHIGDVSGAWRRKWPNDDIAAYRPCKKIKRALSNVKDVEVRDDRIYVPGLPLPAIGARKKLSAMASSPFADAMAAVTEVLYTVAEGHRGEVEFDGSLNLDRACLEAEHAITCLVDNVCTLLVGEESIPLPNPEWASSKVLYWAWAYAAAAESGLLDRLSQSFKKAIEDALCFTDNDDEEMDQISENLFKTWESLLGQSIRVMPKPVIGREEPVGSRAAETAFKLLDAEMVPARYKYSAHFLALLYYERLEEINAAMQEVVDDDESKNAPICRGVWQSQYHRAELDLCDWTPDYENSNTRRALYPRKNDLVLLTPRLRGAQHDVAQGIVAEVRKEFEDGCDLKLKVWNMSLPGPTSPISTAIESSDFTAVALKSIRVTFDRQVEAVKAATKRNGRAFHPSIRDLIVQSWRDATMIEKACPRALNPKPKENVWKLLKDEFWSTIYYSETYADGIRKLLKRAPKDDDVIKTKTGLKMKMKDLLAHEGDDLEELFPISVRVEDYGDDNEEERTMQHVDEEPATDNDDSIVKSPRALAAEIPEDIQDCIGGSLQVPLSPAQEQAVENARTRRCSLVRGPPGTGKTHTACAMVQCWLEQGPSRVLVVAQSNTAALNIQERMNSFGVECARVGSFMTAKEIRDQRSFQEHLDPDSKHKLEQADPNKPLGQSMLVPMLQKVINKVSVLVMTCISSGNGNLLCRSRFSRVLIDEAAQATEPTSLVPLMAGAKAFVCIGDDRQLPATVHSREAKRLRFDESLFERLLRVEVVSKGNGFQQLDIQRRMHSTIAEFPGAHFYGGALENGCLDEERPPIRGFDWPADGNLRVCFVDIDGATDVSEDSSRKSTKNEAEADMLVSVLEQILCDEHSDVSPENIAVITGYSAQRQYLRRKIGSPSIRVDTVDGFQGMERDLVLVSTVRSNYRGKVGFLSDKRRANVLLTRARCGLIVFGSYSTLSQETITWKPWLDWIGKKGGSIAHVKLSAVASEPSK